MTTRRNPLRAMLIPAPGDNLCLAFANTLCWRGRPTPSEGLAGIEDLLRWLAGTANMPAAAIEMAASRLDRRPTEASGLFAAAIGLREAIYRIFAACAASEPVSDKDLALLNGALGEAPRREKLAQFDGGFAWETKEVHVSAAGLLAPVSWSAAELLTHADRRRVQRCANDACLWLFVDESKAGTRRWCDMSSCGNR
ncbi:MAG: ABATE domain-containing protein, partial [Alphaproteobacteria bacterium]|nr:ABATE domain-containing protein [Alphaproteobacteria bacterium]